MSDRVKLSDFREEFVNRVIEARKATGMSQDSMAKALGIDQGTYKQYEGRSLLPHRHVAQFCAITRRSEAWLFTGKDRRR